ncbi:hypothetical protein [Rhodohalobacter sulfatireducens]|uniref:Uncharacterized protein n=1 Tax=Rhodohalobacter sulfatireducens TaxID=2911366 RepID=A0ABS9KBJ2_9BACT|nr:hypothetical protein [Rhodohalobacter sulfatireducens]MCG2588202.1 hypothetical protein [Rhodohalobacter sulfatireducens]
MKAEAKRSNLLVLLSVAFFLCTSAFTLIPEANNANASTQSICWTCSLGPGGVPTGCAIAEFCGMTTCNPLGGCELSGVLCGSDCGGGGDPGEPGETEDPG